MSELVTTVTEAFPVGQTLSQAEQGCDLGQSPPLWSSIATSVNENNSFRVVRKFNEKKKSVILLELWVPEFSSKYQASLFFFHSHNYFFRSTLV